MTVPQLTVLSREYCHLCHDMVAALQALQGEAGFALQVVDVDLNPNLEQRYGEKVPVLLAGGQHLQQREPLEICHYHLDVARLNAYLAEFR